MARPITLTPKQAKRLHLASLSEQEKLVGVKRQTSHRRAKTLRGELEALLARIAPLAQAAGWECGLYRCWTDDPYNARYQNDTRPRENALVAWRTDGGGIRHIGMVWEIAQWSDEQVRSLLVEKKKREQ
jgi:hypothetical protein